MKISRFSFVAALAIALVGAPASSAAVKAGASCQKAGQVTTVAGSKFTCVKKSGKLVWVKSVVKSPAAIAPTASASASATATPSPSASVAVKPSAKPSATPVEVVPMKSSPALPSVTLAKVKENNSAASCWTIVNGNVYDLTKWAAKHPGGPQVIRSLCGIDGTSAFLGRHRNQTDPQETLDSYLLGPLAK